MLLVSIASAVVHETSPSFFRPSLGMRRVELFEEPTMRARVNSPNTNDMSTNASPHPTEIAFAEGTKTCS